MQKSSDPARGQSETVLARARDVRAMIFDVDGVMTDGRLWYGPQGESMKCFHVLDGHGVKMLAAHGVPCAILSGRRSEAVARRAAELGIGHVIQGSDDKSRAFDSLIEALGIAPRQAGYMGDDLVDVPVLRRCGFACAPREALAAVRTHAHYVTAAPAGAGAVREVCEFILHAQGALDQAIAPYMA